MGRLGLGLGFGGSGRGTHAGGVSAITLVAVGAFADDLAIDISVLVCSVCVACATGSDILSCVVADVALAWFFGGVRC